MIRTSKTKDIIFYHYVECSNSSNATYRGLSNSIVSKVAGFGKNLVKTGQVALTPGFLRVFNQFEVYRDEARNYGVRIGMILSDPFGMASSDIELTDGSVTKSSIQQYDECQNDTIASAITTDFVRRLSRINYVRDIVLAVGSYPDLDYKMTEFYKLVKEYKLGVIYKDAFTHHDQSLFFKTLEEKINISDGRAWFGNFQDISNTHFINKNVKLYADYDVWENTSLFGMTARENAPLFSIQHVNDVDVNFGINNALAYSETMNISADVTKLSNSQRTQLWQKLYHHQQNRRKKYG